MAGLPDIQERERFVALLIMGEILTKRGELGPLARVWRPVGKRRPAPDKKQPTPQHRETE